MPQDLDVRTGLIRVLVVAFLCVGFWALARYGTYRPPLLGVDAPSTHFSGARAEDALARILGSEKPHPTSTDENGAVRARILNEYARLGIPAKTYRALGCRLGRGLDFLACATVTDVLAQVRPGNGKAIIMLSHYDSVPAGPGAADDGAGTAAVIEASRALKAIPDPGVHPVIAINTDGEEFGLLGAAALLENRQIKSVVGAVVNVEARGNQGPSLLFQTSPGDGPFVNLYGDSVRAYATSSLFPLIYKALPNDTDLTLFINDGFPSWNFAFSDRVAHYHTALDRRENLDPQSLQMQGENLLGVTNSLAHTDFGTLNGANDIYISILGVWLPRLPASWAPLLSAATLALVLFAISRGRGSITSWRNWLPAVAIFPLTIVIAAISGWIAHGVASLVSGYPDPSYAHPDYLRAALSFAVLGSALVTVRLAQTRESLLSAWLWTAVLALLLSMVARGLSPYFLFPVLIAAPILVGIAIYSDDWHSLPTQVIAVIASVPALIIWFSLAAAGETINGLLLHPLFTIPSAIGLAMIAPVLSGLPRRARLFFSSGAFAASLLFAVIAGLQPPYSTNMPQRLSIQYVEVAGQGGALWAADAIAPLPSSLSTAASFSSQPGTAYPFAPFKAYLAPAGTPQFPYPSGSVGLGKTASSVRHIDIALHGSNLANQMILAIPKEGGLRGIAVNGKHFALTATSTDATRRPYSLIGCFSRDCAQAVIGLDLTTRNSVRLFLAEVRYGLPPAGRRLISARPSTATPSQNGDTTVLINSISVPAG